MTPVIPYSISNVSLIPGTAFTTRRNYSARLGLSRRAAVNASCPQSFLLSRSASFRLLSPYGRGCSLHSQSRLHFLRATETEVAVEEPESSVSGEVPSDDAPAQSKRARPVKKSDLPPVSNEELVAGATFTGKVRSIQPFGAFVDFGAFTDGLVHVSQLSDSFVKEVGSVVSVGQEVKVRLLEANMESGRISLSMRENDDGGKERGGPGRKNSPRPGQRKGDPKKASKFAKGQDLEGTVKNMNKAGSFIALPEGEEGFLPISEEIDDGFGTMMGESTLEVGQEVSVRVLRISRGQLTLTMKKEENIQKTDVPVGQGVVHTATNPFLLAFRKNKDIAAFLDEREKVEEAVAPEVPQKPEETATEASTPSSVLTEAETTDDQQAEDELPVEEAKEVVIKDEVAVQETEDATVKEEVVEPVAEETTVKDEVAVQETDDATVKEESVEPVADDATIKDEVAVQEADDATVKEEIVEPVAEETIVKEEVVEPVTEETTVKDEVTAEDETTKEEVIEPVAEEATVKDGVAEQQDENVAVKDDVAEPVAEETIVQEEVAVQEAEEKVPEEIAPENQQTSESDTNGSVASADSQPDNPPSEAAKATISPALVKQLRDESGAGMMDCKRALSESGGDIVKATEYLRKKGLASAEKKASRATAEGRIGSYIHDSRIGVLVELNCETDFVARGEIFKELVDDLAMQVAACPQVQYIASEDVPEELVNKEREIEMQKEDLASKPEQIRSKIVDGRVKKRLDELALLEQAYIKNDKVLMKDWVKQTISTVGENIKVKRFVRYNLGEGLEKKSQDFAAEVAAQTTAKQAAPKAESPASPEEVKETVEKPPTVAVSASLVKQLRDETGAGMMDCKKALSESGGDMEKAQEYLRKKGLSSADKKSSRLAAEGRIGAYIHDSRIGVLIEVNCETDFVARNEAFKELVDDLAMQVVACPSVSFVSVDDVGNDVVEKEKELERQREDLRSKPESIREKIVEGRVAKRLGELALLEQPFVKNDAILVKDLLKQTVATLGENIKVRRFVRFTLGEA